MPNYDYRCDTCYRSFEAFAAYGDHLQQMCPRCGVLAPLTWRKFPGAKIDKGEHYDQQFRRHFKSEQEKEAWAKAQGFTCVSAKEFEEKAFLSDDPPTVDKDALVATMKQTWEQAHAGTLPPVEVPKTDERLDTSKILNQNGEQNGGYV